jgi:hypothetical protein
MTAGAQFDFRHCPIVERMPSRGGASCQRSSEQGSRRSVCALHAHASRRGTARTGDESSAGGGAATFNEDRVRLPRHLTTEPSCSNESVRHLLHRSMPQRGAIQRRRLHGSPGRDRGEVNGSSPGSSVFARRLTPRAISVKSAERRSRADSGRSSAARRDSAPCGPTFLRPSRGAGGRIRSRSATKGPLIVTHKRVGTENVLVPGSGRASMRRPSTTSGCPTAGYAATKTCRRTVPLSARTASTQDARSARARLKPRGTLRSSAVR